MKKTTLLLLTSCALAGCYTTPEMTENKYRDFYSDTSVCGTSTMYQNKNLRECIENRLEEEDKEKKTISILPLPNGETLIVPKTQDDLELKDTNRVYEVIDIRTQTSVVIENGQMPEEAINLKETETQENIILNEEQSAEQKTEETEEAKELTEASDATEEIEEAKELTEASDASDETLETLETFEEVEELKEMDATVPEEQIEVVEFEEIEETIIGNGGQDTKTEQMADGVTLVVGPLKEDLVIEVKSAREKKSTVETKTTKTQVKTVQPPTEETTTLTKEEIREKRIAEARKKAAERRNLQKNQKEVLPKEEK